METKAGLRIGDGGGSFYDPTIFNINSCVRDVMDRELEITKIKSDRQFVSSRAMLDLALR